MSDGDMKPDNELDALLEAEIEAALGDLSIDEMLGTDDPKPRAKGERDYRTGTVVAVHGHDVMVEFGPKAQGVCPVDQFPEPPAVGAQLEFVVDRHDEADGLLMLSRKGIARKAEWESLDVGQTIEARCTGVNKGGLEMELAHHKGFMPAGQVDLRHIPDLSVFVGEKMPCEVIELDRRRGRIILSRRVTLEAERAELREKLLGELEEGRQMPAVITSIQPYGAFADLGGLDGLIHISDLSYERVQHPSEVVKQGDQVQVQILKVDRESDPPRVGLGMKQCMADPFESESALLDEGGTVTGKVTKLAAFGAFVQLAPGVEGLIHISELAHERVNKVSQIVNAGEIVTVKVLSVDPGKKRISLSLKAMKQAAEESAERKEDPEMRKLKAQLSKKFGELKGGIG